VVAVGEVVLLVAAEAAVQAEVVAAADGNAFPIGWV
jgi:hypothetical protein